MATSIGGKSKPPVKRKMPDLLILGIGKKDDAGAPPPSGSPSNPPTSPSNSPSSPSKPDAAADDKYAGKGPNGTTIKPGQAHFTDQTQTCSKCEWFNPEGNNGVGECKMGVPEADFSKSDPDASQCDYFEANDDATETPEQEAAENEPQPEGANT